MMLVFLWYSQLAELVVEVVHDPGDIGEGF